MAILPCDICGKTGHAWFQCSQRSTKPANWKPDRLLPRKDRATVTATIGQPLPKQGSAPAADAQLEGGKRSTSLGRKATAPASKVSAVPDGGSTESQTKASIGNAATADGKITPKRAKPKVAKPAGREMQVGATGGAGAPDLTTRGTPRKRAPKGTFDRKAYQAQKARERRARLKEGKAK